MKKRVWISGLDKEEAAALVELQQLIIRYGLKTAGHFWDDNLDQMAWLEAGREIAAPETALWVIAGPVGSFQSPPVQFGLSLAAMAVQARRGAAFPIMAVATSGRLEAEALPTMLQGTELLTPASQGLGPKVAALANLPVGKTDQPYRLDIHGLPNLGHWFEVGPGSGRTWEGALFGVSEGAIVGHGVGPAGSLPERSVLEYPTKDLKAALGGTEFTAWSVKNRLDEKQSYFVGVPAKDYPSALIFGPMSEADDPEVFVVRLKSSPG